jgi:hypothetical protein
MQNMNWNSFRQNVERTFRNTDTLNDLVEFDASCATPAQLYRLLLWDTDAVKTISSNGILITDNHPFTEFPLWRYLIKGRKQWRPQYDLNIGDWMGKNKSERSARVKEPLVPDMSGFDKQE